MALAKASARELSDRLSRDASIYQSEIRVARNQSLQQMEKVGDALAVCESKLQTALADNERLKAIEKRLEQALEDKTSAERDASRVKVELLDAKRALDGAQKQLKVLENAARNLCAVPEHAKFEAFVAQNATLRQVVKAMRQERTQHSSEALEETEQRVRKLEELVLKFKSL